MNKKNISLRALRIYHSYNPKYFPVKGLQILFDNVTPYFTLWMSAEIITALYEGRPKEHLYTLVAVILLGNLVIRLGSAVLTHISEIQLKILRDQEILKFHAKTMSLDYEKLESPAIRQHRRQVEENSHINGYGMEFLRINVEGLWEAGIHLVLCGVLFAEMFLMLTGVGFQPIGIALIMCMVLCVILNVLVGTSRSAKLADAHKKVGDCMLESNRLGRGYRPSGMDNRIYKQQPLVVEQYQPIYRMHLKTMSHMFDQDYRTSFPMLIADQVMELCAFLIVCYYCTLGIFPMGSVIKYVGYLG
ncbi:MAG: hypothetical protein J6I64_06670, partial [Lachnospiraceae bacterium]|nr:hypothetical protein [Lachnospiraceae bacterium]